MKNKYENITKTSDIVPVADIWQFPSILKPSDIPEPSDAMLHEPVCVVDRLLEHLHREPVVLRHRPLEVLPPVPHDTLPE